MNIRSRTTITQINKDGPQTPTAPSFRFINTGDVTVYVNNMPLQPKSSIGDDSSGVLASMIHKIGIKGTDKVTYTREDVYNISFGADDTLSQITSQKGLQDPTKRQSLYLIQTFYFFE